PAQLVRPIDFQTDRVHVSAGDRDSPPTSQNPGSADKALLNGVPDLDVDPVSGSCRTDGGYTVPESLLQHACGAEHSQLDRLILVTRKEVTTGTVDVRVDE